MSNEFKDFSARHHRGPSRTVIILVAVFAILFMGIGLGGTWLHNRSVVVAEARARTAQWTFTGPACPQLTKTQFDAMGAPPSKSFQFTGIRFNRRFGNVDCATIGMEDVTLKGAYPVCQFTAPALIEVVTPTGRFYFAPGVGHRAAISVPDGQAKCVMNGPPGA